jgi:hypothetical protein
MICLRCGQCCVEYGAVVMRDPVLGIVKGNAVFKPAWEKCFHLKGNAKGEYSCAIHDESFYKQTPCFHFGQSEPGDSNCRMGKRVMRKNKIPWKFWWPIF